MKKEKTKRNLKEKGITLVALVVTVIILLILAGVTINIALSENGLFHRAKNAADRYKVAQTNEQDLLTNLDKELDEYTQKPLVTTVTDTAHTDNKKVQDSLGNPLVIPSGFKYVEGTNVEDGIVIEDKDGNQFVWIPVSNINGNNDGKGTGLIKTTDKGNVEITLGRYTFKREKNESDEYVDGTPELVQRGSQRESDDSDFVIKSFYRENTNLVRENGGKGTEYLDEFVKSVENNHGYYLARYEAGKGTDNKPVSKTGEVWKNTTQSVALEAAQRMYVENENYKSDLVNSYAWDTAIVFIEKMEDANYANQGRGENTSLKNTGATGDEKCNIYDMAGNVGEWVTEYSTKTEDNYKGPCVTRGGAYVDDYSYSVSRNFNPITGHGDYISFRPLLIIK